MNGTVSLVVVVFSALGGLAGVVGLLQFFNTRRQVKDKATADIASVWNDLTEGALKSAYSRISDLEKKDVGHNKKEELLVDLVQDMIRDMASNTQLQYETYQDRLDELRRM